MVATASSHLPSFFCCGGLEQQGVDALDLLVFLFGLFVRFALLLGEAGFLGGGSSLLGEVDVVDVIDGQFDGHIVEVRRSVFHRGRGG